MILEIKHSGLTSDVQGRPARAINLVYFGRMINEDADDVNKPRGRGPVKRCSFVLVSLVVSWLLIKTELTTSTAFARVASSASNARMRPS